MTQAYRNWNEARGRHIGEILSGVNRNAENIVQLETDYTAADGAVTTAYISADAVVASDATSARATLSTTLTAAYQAADATQQTEIDGIDTRVTSSESSITTLQSTTASNTGAIATNSTNISANTTAISSNDTDISGLTTRVTTAEADITTNATAVTTESTARASADTTLQAQITSNDSDIAGNATNITTNTATISSNYTTLVAADTAEASARETLEVRRVSMLPGSLLTNPRFDYPSTSPGVPYGWGNYGVGSQAVLADKPSSLPGQCCQMAATLANTEQGIYQDANEIEPSRTYLVSAEILRGSDFLHRSGVLVQWFNSSSVYLSDARISFATDESTSGEVSTVHDGVVRFEKIITSPANAAFARVYAMNSWVSLSGSSSTPNIYWFECDLKPVSITDARTEILREAFIGSDGAALARLSLTAAAGSDPARLSLLDGAGGSNIALDADEIFFGSDTVFENTHDTFYTEASSYRYRDRGPFGTSGDLLQWYGPTSVSLNSETKTNGVFALATDGKVYYGTAELGGREFSLSGDFLIVVEAPGSGASGTTSAYSMTVSNNDGAVTYKWYYVGGSTAITISNDAINNPTFTATPGAGNVLQATWRCIAEDSSGAEAVLDLIVQISDAFA